MALSNDAIKALIFGMGDQTLGNELASAVDKNTSFVSQWNAVAGHTIVGIIVAAHVSTTTDFGSLLVDDVILHLKAADSTVYPLVCVTDGTLPEAAVVSDYYIVLRAWSFAAPTADAVVI